MRELSYKLAISIPYSNTIIIIQRATITVGVTAETALPQLLQEEEESL